MVWGKAVANNNTHLKMDKKKVLKNILRNINNLKKIIGNTVVIKVAVIIIRVLIIKKETISTKIGLREIIDSSLLRIS